VYYPDSILMGIRVALNHRTQYRYDEPVALGPQWIRLRPAAHSRTPILSYSLRATPSEYRIHWLQDAYNNHVARLLLSEKTREFTIDIDLVAELSVINPFDFFLEPGTESFPFRYAPDLMQDLQPYLVTEPAGPRVQAFLAETSRESRGTVGFLVDLNRRVRDSVGYVTRMEAGIQRL